MMIEMTVAHPTDPSDTVRSRRRVARSSSLFTAAAWLMLHPIG